MHGNVALAGLCTSCNLTDRRLIMENFSDPSSSISARSRKQGSKLKDEMSGSNEIPQELTELGGKAGSFCPSNVI